MPRFYLTAVAAAVIAATVNAAEFPAIPTDQTDYNEIIYRDDANDPTSYEQSSWKGIGLVASGKTITGGNAPAFLSTRDYDKVTNNGNIWVLADRIEDTDLGQYAAGIVASGGKTGINAKDGIIYVHSNNNGIETNYEAAKGMAADASSGTKTSITNSGTIYVEGGTGMLATSNPKTASAPSSKKGSVITNEGTIHIINSGFGMSLGGNDASGVEMTNKGTIIASGKNAYGITASDATYGKVTNEGTIIATDGAIAISSGRWNKDVEFSLTLTGNSHVEGVIELGKASKLTVENLARAETIVLSSGTPEKVNALDGAPCEGCNVGSVHVNNSNLTIRSSDESQTLKIGLIETQNNGSTTFEFDSVGSKDKLLLDIDKVGEDAAVKFNYTGTVTDKLANGSVKAEELFNGISLGDNGETPKLITTSDGLWASASVHEKKGDEITSTYSGPSCLVTSTTDLALMNGLVWRSQLTNLSDRMGTLRTMPQAAGAWARYNNGRLDGRGLEYDYSTIEVGFDAPVSSNFLVGVSFDYTIGDTDLNAGSADNDVYTVGLYGTYYGDNGGFVDLMAKIGRIDNEYTVSNTAGLEKGDYMMTGAIVGIEAGHRFDLAHNLFVEPQVQLSYSWLRATDYATNIRSVDFETIESLVARVGVMGGMKFAENRGAAYLKASYNHDFLGNVDAAMYAVNGSGNSAKISDELDDNWAEVSLGVSYSVTDTLNTFLDVGTGFGGDIDQKWRINFGARYAF